MSAETEYLDRLKSVMQMAKGRRDGEAKAVAAAMSAMSSAIGQADSFRAMDSKAFPFAIVDGGHEIPDGPPDFGASVCVLRDPRGVSRVTAQARTGGADVTVECYLHPTADGSRQWRVQSDIRTFDGGSQTSGREFTTASDAVTAFRQRLLLVVLPVLSRGTISGVPTLPDGDPAAAEAVKASVAAAAAAGEEARAKKERLKQETAKCGHSVWEAWNHASRDLAFLAEAGYFIDRVKDGRGITTRLSPSGIEVTLHSAEEWTLLAVEAHSLRPEMVEFSTHTQRGGKERRGFLPGADRQAVAAEIRSLVLDEIEALERSFLHGASVRAHDRSGAPAA